MKNLFVWVFKYVAVSLILLLVFPLMLFYTLISSFWRIFWVTVVSFLIIGLLGGTYEQCVTYSGSLGFFVGVYIMYRERSKE